VDTELDIWSVGQYGPHTAWSLCVVSCDVIWYDYARESVGNWRRSVMTAAAISSVQSPARELNSNGQTHSTDCN